MNLFLNILRTFKDEGLSGVNRKAKNAIQLIIYSNAISLINLFKLFMQCRLSLIRSSKNRLFKVVDAVKVGYAVRSIAIFSSQKYGQLLATADAGSDTISIVPFSNSKFKKRSTIHLPPKSAPISISPICYPAPDRSDGFAFSVFNFDDSGECYSETHVDSVDSIDQITQKTNSSTKIDIGEIGFNRILHRNGHWGFRCVNSYTDRNGTVYMAAVDRSEDILYILEFDGKTGTIQNSIVHKVHLNFALEPAEPIFAGIIPSSDGLAAPRFCTSQRHRNDLTLVKKNKDGNYVVIDRIAVPGASRSSVTIGRFRATDRCDLAVALWGGDPKDLRSVLSGEVAVLLSEKDGKYDKIVTFPAGIHPTDVAAGDFDGDGLDELAVLNYGSGLAPYDRFHQGSIQIFKYQEGQFVELDEIFVPYPRIAYTFDMDQNGKDELIVSLFFEKRLVIIKQI